METTKSKSTPDEDEVRVYYLHTSKGLFPLPVLTEIEKQAKAESRRLRAEEKYLGEEGLVPLPFNAGQILTLEDNCSYFDACVRQIARDVIGQGWEIVLKRGKEENKAEKEKIENFIANSGGKNEETFGQTLEQAVIDYNSVGWLGIEVSRPDEIDGMWHIPAYTLRVHSSHNKFCQIRDNRKKWFKRFKCEEDVNEETGRKDGKKDKKAHELIYRRRYYPKDDYYGCPPILPAVGSVIGLIGIRDYNLAFFENYGIPAGLVIIKGKCSDETAKQISDFIDVEIKGSSSAHKTMVMRVPEGGEIIYERLSTEVKEGSFEKLDKKLRDHVLSSYNMPPYQIGIVEEGSLGGTTAIQQTRIYARSTVKPIEMMINHLVTKDIIEDGLKCESYEFRLEEMSIRDLAAEIARDEMLFSMAATTANQLIQKYNLGETFPEGDERYVASKYLPAGEESVEKREQALFAGFEELKAKIDKIIKKGGKK